METIDLVGPTLAAAVAKAKAVIAEDGVVIFPTDTLYGLGADAFSDVAVDAVYKIKGRDAGKPIHCIVADLEMAARYVELDGNAQALAQAFLPGALTLILRKKEGVQGGIARDMNTVGIRIPRNHFCVDLARALDRPYTATSANRAGEAPPRSPEEILSQLGQTQKDVQLLVDAGTLPQSLPSTVVDLSEAQPVILREGAIPAADIWNALRIEL